MTDRWPADPDILDRSARVEHPAVPERVAEHGDHTVLRLLRPSVDQRVVLSGQTHRRGDVGHIHVQGHRGSRTRRGAITPISGKASER